MVDSTHPNVLAQSGGCWGKTAKRRLQTAKRRTLKCDVPLPALLGSFSTGIQRFLVYTFPQCLKGEKQTRNCRLWINKPLPLDLKTPLHMVYLMNQEVYMNFL